MVDIRERVSLDPVEPVGMRYPFNIIFFPYIDGRTKIFSGVQFIEYNAVIYAIYRHSYSIFYIKQVFAFMLKFRYTDRCNTSNIFGAIKIDLVFCS